MLAVLGFEVAQVTELFARAGGGGSSGGSSGGGGGGLLIALIGYYPVHFVTKWLYTHKSRRAALIGGWITAVLVSVAALMLNVFLGALITFGALAGIHSGIHNWYGQLAHKLKGAKKQVAYAALRDPAWHEPALMQRANDVFMRFQQDWSNFNVAAMSTYLSPRYLAHVQLMMRALWEMGRRNSVESPKIRQSGISNVFDARNNDNDTFTVAFDAEAHDKLIDVASGEVLFADKSSFQEFWRFDREGNAWMLDGIEQATQDASQKNIWLERFAMQHGMFYSLDWGWLLLPRRGMLFNESSFGKSDVNNHVIGEWHGRIVQLYTYISDKRSNRADNYLVAQINLPKSYGGILIRKHSILGRFMRPVPANYQQYNLEWQAFNKRYDVFATDPDRLATFELLNPAFMAYLFDQNLPMEIEVVDNTVYLYALVSYADIHYETMLSILLRAFRELKL